jgi:hypothetical protein
MIKPMKKAENISDEKPSRYDSFEGFVVELILELKRRNKPLDGWLAAIVALLGPSVLERITKVLNIQPGNQKSLSSALSAALPILGAVTGAITGLMIAKYLAKAHTEEGVSATNLLKKAETLYKEYGDPSLTESEKMELINELFEDVIAEKEINA